MVGPPNTRFVSKPVEIEAHRIGIDPWPDAAWEAVTRNEIRLYDCGKPDGYIIVRTLEGEMRGNHGDWLIRGTEGEFYPCKPSVFERKYEARTLLSSSRGEQGWRNALDELLGACQRYDADPCSTLAIADYLEAKDHAAEVLAAASSAPGSVPTSTRSLSALADELKLVSAFLHETDADGLMAVVERAIDVLQGSVPTSLAGQGTDYTTEALANSELDFLDQRASEWMAETSVQRMFNAIASVFEKYASQEIMDRFRTKLGALGHQCFVEGAMRAWDEISTQQRRLGNPLPSRSAPQPTAGGDADAK